MMMKDGGGGGGCACTLFYLCQVYAASSSEVRYLIWYHLSWDGFVRPACCLRAFLPAFPATNLFVLGMARRTKDCFLVSFLCVVLDFGTLE